MSSKTHNRKQLIEESIEAKPRNRSVDPTTLNDEIKNLWKDMIDTSRQDVIGGAGKSIGEQLLGGGDLSEGQEIALSQARKAKQEAEEETVVASEHIEYFRTVQNTESFGDQRAEREVKQAVENIRAEIKNLMKTSKIVERTVKDATAEQAPVKPGKYHISFFEFVLSVLRDATRKLEDAANLGAVFTSKKQQSKYWTKYKSHGTQFGLSGERTTATQTG
jgi:hypothetical protein